MLSNVAFMTIAVVALPVPLENQGSFIINWNHKSCLHLVSFRIPDCYQFCSAFLLPFCQHSFLLSAHSLIYLPETHPVRFFINTTHNSTLFNLLTNHRTKDFKKLFLFLPWCSMFLTNLGTSFSSCNDFHS